jgi:Uma2 family endonuclease
MSLITPSQSMPSPPPPALYRMTVDEFERIADSLDDDQVELINGYIVGREDMKPSHVIVTERLRRRLESILPSSWLVREDKPIRIPDFDEPRPDLAVVRGDPERYAHHHPGPADVALLIEESDASLQRDQGDKLMIYAQAGIPVYWIANLVNRRIELYGDPGPGGYASRVSFGSGQNVPVVIGGVHVGTVGVDSVLG